MWRRGRLGFTLIELMVVIAIISLLVVFLVLGFSGGGRSAGVKATRALILQLTEACDRFKAVYGFYPPDAVGTGRSASWKPGDPLPWNDSERCIFVTDARVDSPTYLYIGILEWLGLADPSAAVDSCEALTFCLLLEKDGGRPFISVEQKQLANFDSDTFQPYFDQNNDGERQAGEDVGSRKPLLEIVDPWGTPLRFYSPAGRNENAMKELKNRAAVEVYSAGPNRKFGWNAGSPALDGDDIASWQPAVE
jgi:prepilin-type N-terminal cleavage/methylation domain-containing protein